MVRGNQRYRCRACGRTFTDTEGRGKSVTTKALAQILYATGTMSLRAIAQILGVSDVAVFNWVRASNKVRGAMPSSMHIEVVSVDCIGKKLKNKNDELYFGDNVIVLTGDFPHGQRIGILIPLKNSKNIIRHLRKGAV